MTNYKIRKSSLPGSLQAVIDEQEASWKNGNPILTETLLQRHPHIHDIPDAILELVYNEAILREQHGEIVELSQLQARFPHLATALKMQWEVDRALVSQPATTGIRLPLNEPDNRQKHGNVGRYRIDRLLGTGGMGVVYQSWDPVLERLLALKMLHNHNHTEEALARFRTEASAIAQIQHPHIVQIFDIGSDDGKPYFVMEYCAGGTLAERLKGGPLPPRESASILAQIGRGVMAAHERQILHRDLKPSNIMLIHTVDSLNATGSTAVEGGSTNPSGMPRSSESQNYKVTDFGLAKDLSNEDGQTQSGAILGTPNYMPPEQAFGQIKNLKPTADIYSLGAILYECLTGRPPFQGATMADTLNQVREQEPVPVRQLQPSVPQDLETICQKCLNKEPSGRYLTATEFVEDLGHFLEGKAILARPTGPVERTWRWAKRNPKIAVLSGSLALLITIAAVGGTLLSLTLNSALGEAKRDRDRATDSERQTREHLAESQVAAAKLALQRGNGRVALQQLNAAADAGLDTPDLRFLRVKALCAIHNVTSAIEEVRMLATRDDLGELAGEVLLWKADLELDAQSVELQQGLQQIRLALESGLSIADQHYANGLLAKSLPEALKQFRQAVQADPTNPRTNAVLTMLLVLAGEFPEARERLVAARLLFPDHPVFLLIQTILDALQNQPLAVRSGLTVLRQKLGDSSYQLASGTVGFCQDMTDFIHELEKLQCSDPKVNSVAVFLTLQRSLMKILPLANSGIGDLYLPFPPGLLSEFRGITRELPSVYSFVMPGNWLANAQALERLATMTPDAFFLLYAARLRAKSGDLDQLYLTSELYQRAAKSRSMLPVHRMNLYGAAVAESDLYHRGPKSEEPVHRAKSIHYISQLAAQDLLPAQAQKLLEHCERLNVPPELTWSVFASWERADKTDPRLPLVRAKLYMRSHDYETAIQLADEHLKIKDNAEWRKLRDESRAELQRLAKATLGTALPK